MASVRRLQVFTQFVEAHAHQLHRIERAEPLIVGGEHADHLVAVHDRHAGRGGMTRAVRALTPFAFGTLHLHRLEAACLPHNGASMRLLEKVGFRRVGVLRQYWLGPEGEWRDGVLLRKAA